MIKKSDFPKRIYVYFDEDRGGKYLVANYTDRDCADLDEDRLVGIYNLESVGKITTSVVIGKIK